MSSYLIQYIAAWIVFVVGVVSGAVAAAGQSGMDLGMSKLVYNWCSLIVTICATVSPFLPSIRRPPVSTDDAGPAGHVDPMPRDR